MPARVPQASRSKGVSHGGIGHAPEGPLHRSLSLKPAAGPRGRVDGVPPRRQGRERDAPGKLPQAMTNCFGTAMTPGLDARDGTGCQDDLTASGHGDRGAGAVNIDEDSYHEKGDRQIAAPVADKGKRHPLVREQRGGHADIDRCLQGDQQEDSRGEQFPESVLGIGGDQPPRG